MEENLLNDMALHEIWVNTLGKKGKRLRLENNVKEEKKEERKNRTSN